MILAFICKTYLILKIIIRERAMKGRWKGDERGMRVWKCLKKPEIMLGNIKEGTGF